MTPIGSPGKENRGLRVGMRFFVGGKKLNKNKALRHKNVVSSFFRGVKRFMEENSERDGKKVI